MKQLTIYCSEEFSDDIVRVFRKHAVESYVHMPGLYGNKLKQKGGFEKDQAWPSNAFVLFLEPQQLSGIVPDLKEFAQKCHVEACLRLVVSQVEKIV